MMINKDIMFRVQIDYRSFSTKENDDALSMAGTLIGI